MNYSGEKLHNPEFINEYSSVCRLNNHRPLELIGEGDMSYMGWEAVYYDLLEWDIEKWSNKIIRFLKGYKCRYCGFICEVEGWREEVHNYIESKGEFR